MRVLWKSPCETHCFSKHENAFPCVTDGCDSSYDCPMNLAAFAEYKEYEAQMYDSGFAYGAWVVHTDKIGLFPVCELVFFREEPTEDSLREIYGSHFLRFSHFAPRVPD